jgi:excisionase family DNA binding protein
MAARRVNPCVVKMHRSYTAGELAERLGVHKNTVRNWQREGLTAIDQGRPRLFQGESVRNFLSRRNASRKRPCPPGTLYCLRCRAPRVPALGMAEYSETRPGAGNLKALCGTCEAPMHRRTRQASLATVLPEIAVQVSLPPERLSGRTSPSLNCDRDRQGAEP